MFKQLVLRGIGIIICILGRADMNKEIIRWNNDLQDWLDANGLMKNDKEDKE
jgi:hypothetical protein